MDTRQTMYLKIIIQFFIILASTVIFITAPLADTFNTETIMRKLGWVISNENQCGGYYLEAPFPFPESLVNTGAIQITSNQYLYARHGTSMGQGDVTITRLGQQVIANKAYLYRDATGEISSVDLMDEVILRQPNSLVIANRGSFNVKTKAESLYDILYRTTIYGDSKTRPAMPSYNQLQQPQKIYQLTAWGQACSFIQNRMKIYEFNQATYTTCPPTGPVWKVVADHIELNKQTGRGTARHARVLVKGVPIFYSPYLNFPIDSRRKTGFLWPTIGTSGKYGKFLTTPFYWNLAPNYDLTTTPAYLTERIFQLSNYFRYLSSTSRGNFLVDILPHDPEFGNFQNAMEREFGNNPDPIKQSELRRLKDSTLTRHAFNWVNHTRFNEHWSNEINFNYVSDDYYLKDIRNNFNQATQNQLLQFGELTYKGQNWNFITRVQGYQTLHPVNENIYFRNQYTRLPQFLIAVNYPDNPGGFDYFLDNDITHFNIQQNPGLQSLELPIGNRFHTQPGVSRPFIFPYFTITPRLNLALTKYTLSNVSHSSPPIPGTLDNENNRNPSAPGRALPIFDVHSSMYFDRKVEFFNYRFRQTLEPQIYYTYIPYRNQNRLPVFDTTVNTLTYDQLFLYNRFSGIDRINDANQIAYGLSTRFISQQTGIEKIRASLGQILYFRDRKVTLCSSFSDPDCLNLDKDTPADSENKRRFSPLSGLFTYAVDPYWSLTANMIWNPQIRKLDNESIALHYQPSPNRIINFGYNFVRDGDRLFPSEKIHSTVTNLSTTDFSFSWPLLRDWTAVGRWTQNWNHHHFQNLLYGLQYDSCCWAIRFVVGRTFVGLNPQNNFLYNSQVFLQFALKGLGTVPVHGGDPSQVLNTNISGIQNNFGRDF